MMRLHKFKEWHSLDDAARYLAIALGESVTSADVLRLGLDGHLKLSVHLVNGAYARPLFPRNLSEIEFTEVPSIDATAVIAIPSEGSLRTFGDQLYQTFKAITKLDSAVWDLPMLGAERLDVEHQFQMLSGGPAVTAEPVDDPVLLAATNGSLYELQAHFSENEFFKGELAKPYHHLRNFYPASGLPTDAVMVVRAASLKAFERLAMGDDSPFEAPFFDADALDYPELLAIAVRAWEHARKSTEGTPKQRVFDYLAARYPTLPQGSREAVAQVANWQRAGGRPPKKVERGE